VKKVILLALLALPFVSLAQLKILESTTSTTNVDGMTLDKSGNPASVEFVDYLWVVNEGSSSLELKVKRTEVDVQAGTENATCWKVCPAAVAAGSQPVLVSAFSEEIAVGDTNATFSAHHYLNGQDGCSLYKYEWVDAATESQVYATVFIRFLHNTSTTCTASDNEIEDVTFEMYPNPSNDVVNISSDYTSSDASIVVSNILGQQELSMNMSNTGLTTIPVDQLSNGVYFVSISQNGKVLKTEKLVVRH